jgi:hypothetical protein
MITAMTKQHPITPPPELVQEWVWLDATCTDIDVFSAAAQWGADQELEACCEWLVRNYNYPEAGNPLRAARRPRPPSLKEQALEQLDEIAAVFRMTHGDDIVCDKIRRALEALPND